MTFIPDALALELLARQLVPVATAMAEETRGAVHQVLDNAVHTGREFTRRDGTRGRRSAPGEPPAGERYRNSWQVEEAERTAEGVEAAAYTEMGSRDGTLGVDLEYGTTVMAERPHARPALPIAAEAVARIASEVSA